MHRQAGDQVGQHGGTNRGLGGGEGERRGTFTLGNHPHHGAEAAGCLKGKGTPGV